MQHVLISVAIAVFFPIAAVGQVDRDLADQAPQALDNSLGWRRDGTGRYPHSGPYPADLAEGSIQWKTPLPHRSNGSPILVGDRLFVSAEPNVLLCVAADTGDVLWQRATSYFDLPDAAGFTSTVRAELKKAEAMQLARFGKDGLALAHNPEMLSDPEGLPVQYQRPPVHLDAGFTTPTPVSDAEHVYVMYGTGVVTSFALDGTRRWCVYPEKPTIRWGQACSPIIAGGRLIIHTNHCIALNPTTGQEEWRTPVRSRWATPAVVELDGVELLVLGGGEVIRASDGKVLGDLFPHEERSDPYVEYWGASSPVVDGRSIYFVDATPVDSQTTPTVQRFDLRLVDGQRLEATRRWIVDIPIGKYYASPIVHDGKLLTIASTLRTKGRRDFESILNRRADGTLMVLDVQTGELLFGKELGRETGTYHTCSLADQRLWITGHRGLLLAVDLRGDYQEVSRTQLEPTRSNPLFVGRDVIYRGSEHLVRIGFMD